MNPTVNKSDFEDLTTNLKRPSLFLFENTVHLNSNSKFTYLKKYLPKSKALSLKKK